MTAMREESGERLSAGLSDKVSRHEFDALTAMVQGMRSQRHMAAAVLATGGHTTMTPSGPADMSPPAANISSPLLPRGGRTAAGAGAVGGRPRSTSGACAQASRASAGGVVSAGGMGGVGTVGGATASGVGTVGGARRSTKTLKDRTKQYGKTVKRHHQIRRAGVNTSAMVQLAAASRMFLSNCFCCLADASRLAYCFRICFIELLYQVCLFLAIE